jgi:hypothetical protein
MTLLKLPLMSVAVVVVFFSVLAPIFIIPVVARTVYSTAVACVPVSFNCNLLLQ